MLNSGADSAASFTVVGSAATANSCMTVCLDFGNDGVDITGSPISYVQKLSISFNARRTALSMSRSVSNETVSDGTSSDGGLGLAFVGDSSTDASLGIAARVSVDKVTTTSLPAGDTHSTEKRRCRGFVPVAIG
jgi:hypothetical protein